MSAISRSRAQIRARGEDRDRTAPPTDPAGRHQRGAQTRQRQRRDGTTRRVARLHGDDTSLGPLEADSRHA
jgi:hypothetical protein